MKDPSPVAITSRSFSRHTVLRSELLEACSNVVFNDSGGLLKGNELVEFLQGKVKVVMALETFDEALFSRLPDLKVVSKFGVGLDMLDLNAMKRRGIRLAYVPGVNRRAVSELALGLIFSLLRRVVPLCTEVRQGHWRQSQGGQLTGRTVGIIGGGHIGKDLIHLLAPFGCRIFCHDPVADETFMAGHGVKIGKLEDVLRVSDVVSLHVPLNDSTRGMLTRDRLASMKKGALLVNVSRGGIVDEIAVRDLLANDHLGGAAFDVFAAEPPRDAGLLSLPNFIATPHIAGTTVESVLEMGRAAIAGLSDGI